MDIGQNETEHLPKPEQSPPVEHTAACDTLSPFFALPNVHFPQIITENQYDYCMQRSCFFFFYVYKLYLFLKMFTHVLQKHHADEPSATDVLSAQLSSDVVPTSTKQGGKS